MRTGSANPPLGGEGGTSATRVRSVQFDSDAQILNEQGLQQNGSGFLRVFGSTIFFGTQNERQGSQIRDFGRIHFFDQMRLWVHDGGTAREVPGDGDAGYRQ